MKIGYACQTVGVPDTALHTCILKNASNEKLHEICAANLDALEHMLEYNIKNNILLFRISSDIIPFASHPAIDFPWAALFRDRLSALGERARQADMRLSMHPGQYTVLNSPNPEVVARSVDDLRYHCAFLDAMGMDASCKIILHVGGAYGDKLASLERFQSNYVLLDDNIKSRLILENDDRIFTIEEVLGLAVTAGAPVVFDNLHNAVNPSNTKRTEAAWIQACAATWKKADGIPKVHYSQQAADKKPGAHSQFVSIKPFLSFLKSLQNDVDVMLEVKDKNLSAVKCMLCRDTAGKTHLLEKEWAKYKYSVLEHNPKIYQAIRQLLKDKSVYAAEQFYVLLEEALRTLPTTGTCFNALEHVWGYFKKDVSEKEKKRYTTLRDNYANGAGSLPPIKKYLYRLAVKYQHPYLLASYYFLEL